MPKKRSKDPFVTDDFRGINLVSVLYKTMLYDCEGKTGPSSRRKELVAEEQGGFRKDRGCRDQILTFNSAPPFFARGGQTSSLQWPPRCVVACTGKGRVSSRRILLNYFAALGLQ